MVISIPKSDNKRIEKKVTKQNDLILQIIQKIETFGNKFHAGY